MPSVTILHCADFHIGASESFLGAKAFSRRFETLLTFERMVDLAKEKAVDFVLIAGDLLDANTVEKEWVDRLLASITAAETVRFVFAAGNHDPLRADSPFVNRPLPKNFFVLSTKDDCLTFPEKKVRIYGRSFAEVYQNGEERFSLAPEADGFLSLMCQHGELKADRQSHYNAVTADFLRTCGMDYVALGHIHKRTEIGQFGKTRFGYCGCPEGQGFDELGEKGVYLGEVSDTGCSLQFVPLCRRMHLTEAVDVSAVTDGAAAAALILQELESRYGNTFSDHCYKILLTGSPAEGTVLSLPELTGRLNETLYFAKVSDRTVPAVDYALLAAEPTLKGVFVRRMTEKIAAADEADKPRLQRALQFGLTAFDSEVTLRED